MWDVPVSKISTLPQTRLTRFTSCLFDVVKLDMQRDVVCSAYHTYFMLDHSSLLHLPFVNKMACLASLIFR